MVLVSFLVFELNTHYEVIRKKLCAAKNPVHELQRNKYLFKIGLLLAYSLSHEFLASSFFLALAGMLHAGVGGAHVKRFLTAPNMPMLNPNTQKKREREMGTSLEQPVKRSCRRVLQVEGKSPLDSERPSNSSSAASALQDDCSTDISLSYDCAWQRRGGGRSYNSLTGVAHAVGNNTKTIVEYGLRSKSCRICATAARLKRKPCRHDCRKNWSKSSKAMEGDLAA